MPDIKEVSKRGSVIREHRMPLPGSPAKPVPCSRWAACENPRCYRHGCIAALKSLIKALPP